MTTNQTMTLENGREVLLASINFELNTAIIMAIRRYNDGQLEYITWAARLNGDGLWDCTSGHYFMNDRPAAEADWSQRTGIEMIGWDYA